jgi:thiamine transporter ThiT
MSVEQLCYWSLLTPLSRINYSMGAVTAVVVGFKGHVITGIVFESVFGPVDN